MTEDELKDAWKFQEDLPVDATEFSYGNPFFERWEVAYDTFRTELVAETIFSGFTEAHFTGDEED